MKKRIFVIEDEPDMIRIATDLLEADGYQVTASTNPIEALKKIKATPPDLLLLDLRLPDMDGYQVCKTLKSDPKTQSMPIIIVSAKTDETDVVVGLELGADDYVGKPYRQKELLARVKTILRRQTTEPAPEHLNVGPISLDCSRYTATLNKKEIPLTLKEFDLLCYFLRMEDRVLTRTRIYESVWGVDFTGSSRTIDVHVDQLRKKLGKYGAWIVTLKGIGYRFQPDI